MEELPGILGEWAKIRIPRFSSSCQDLHDIRLDVILVDSQFAEWLAGGMCVDGVEFVWLKNEAAKLLGRIGDCRAPRADAEAVAALTEYVTRMQNILGGGDLRH